MSMIGGSTRNASSLVREPDEGYGDPKAFLAMLCHETPVLSSVRGKALLLT